jgi:hypothetical protein
MNAATYPLFDVFVSSLYFALLIFWIILVFHVISDIFKSHDLVAVAKAAGVFFIFLLPLVGCLVYLLARGTKMHERDIQAMQLRQKAFEDYIHSRADTNAE